MLYRVTKHAQKRIRERYRLMFSKDQLDRADWLVRHLIGLSTECIDWKNYPFYANKKRLNPKADRVFCWEGKIFFIVKGDTVVTCVSRWDVRK